MTKGEALKKMQAVKAYMTSGNPIWDVTEIGEAFGMAIEALEQPEIIRCGECTHKDKKIDYCHYLGITICECDYCSYAERRTDAADKC